LGLFSIEAFGQLARLYPGDFSSSHHQCFRPSLLCCHLSRGGGTDEKVSLRHPIVERMPADPCKAQADFHVFSANVGCLFSIVCFFLQPDIIQQLREQAAALKQQRKLLNKELKNASRKRQRLRERARNLSNEDLVKVLAEREAVAQAKAKPKPKAAAKRPSAATEG
jgi:hypothetical protein